MGPSDPLAAKGLNSYPGQHEFRGSATTGAKLHTTSASQEPDMAKLFSARAPRPHSLRLLCRGLRTGSLASSGAGLPPMSEDLRDFVGRNLHELISCFALARGAWEGLIAEHKQLVWIV